jgi:hypothetical protein
MCKKDLSCKTGIHYSKWRWYSTSLHPSYFFFYHIFSSAYRSKLHSKFVKDQYPCVQCKNEKIKYLRFHRLSLYYIATNNQNCNKTKGNVHLYPIKQGIKALGNGLGLYPIQ